MYSLGCVFLEIATLVLGKSLHSFRAHYATPKTDTAVEDAYFLNLERIHTWIDFLEGITHDEPKLEQTLEHKLNLAQVESHDFVPESPVTSDLDRRMIGALPTIRQMLDETPTVRPKAKCLWEKFQYVSVERCRDCDPRHPEVWKPSAEQKQKAEEGTNNRRSMHLIPEENSPHGTHFNGDANITFGNIDSTFLSATDPRLVQKQRRSSSPHIHRRSAGAPINAANGQSVPPRVGHRASSPDSRRPTVNRNPMTSSPRPASPTMSNLGLTKTASNPRATSPNANSRLGNEHRSQSGILHSSSTTHQSSYSGKRNSVSQVPGSPRTSRHNLKSNSGDLAEKQAQKVASDSTHEDDHVSPYTDIIIYDYANESVYVSPYIAIGGMLPACPTKMNFS